MALPDTGPTLTRARSSARRSREEVAKAIWSRLTVDEQRLVSEAAVLGYAEGFKDRGGRSLGDADVMARVLAACQGAGEMHPHLAGLGCRVPARREHESLNQTLANVHARRCSRCGSGAHSCVCRSGWECATCAAEGAPAPWPCVTLRALGRVALCENVLELACGRESACPGVLIVRPDDWEARCVLCGAYCGRDVATYVPVPAGGGL